MCRRSRSASRWKAGPWGRSSNRGRTAFSLATWCCTWPAGATKLPPASWRERADIDWWAAWLANAHRISGRIAFLLTLPVAYHCLWSLGWRSTDNYALGLSKDIEGLIGLNLFSTIRDSLDPRDVPLENVTAPQSARTSNPEDEALLTLLKEIG